MAFTSNGGSIIFLAAGCLSHILYFNKGEHHLWGVRYAQMFLLVNVVAVVLMTRAQNATVLQAVSTATAASTSWAVGALSSLVVYRLFFHPLNKFPGPFMARLTSLWYTTKVAGHAQAHDVSLQLHEKYGPFVRIGSSELSISHPKGPQIVYGLGTKCTKAPWYDLDQPFVSMHTSRSRQLHDQRRRIWSPAFSDKALRGYEDRIRVYGDKLVKQVGAFGGKPVNVSEWFNYYSFDVMGDLAFGESFKMLDAGKEHFAVKLLDEGMDAMHMMLPPWFFRMLTAIPGAAAGYWKFIKYCMDKLDERWEKKQSTPDILSALLAPYATTGKPTGNELSYLQGDARLIIVAGSDTTAATLTFLFYNLARNSEYIEKLRKELQASVTPEGDVNHVDIQDAPILNGCINETLRLFPPVRTAVQRITPPEGIEIDGTHIPGNMTIWCPQYVIGRSEDAYPNAQRFYPERWSSDPKGVLNKQAFAPFSVGVYGCIGKPLALLELRTVATKLIMNYDINFAPGEDGSDLLHKSRDHFTTGLGDMKLTFKERP